MNNKANRQKLSFEKIRAGVKKYIPCYFWIFLVLAAASFICLGIMKSSTSFSDFLNKTTGRGIRFVLTQIFNIFPFSFVETLLIASPVLVIAVFGIMISKGKRSLHFATRFFCALMSVAFVIFSCFVFGYEASYYGTNIEDNVGIDRKDLSPQELYDAAKILLERAEAELDHVSFLQSGSSAMPFDFSELNAKLNADYSKFCEKYPSYQNMYSRIKPVTLSEPWTYTHISGLYSFFTGEANINVNYPDFIIVTTAAHEMSHQRGIGKEDECDFASFLVCTGSDDPYIRYCGYVELYRNIVSRLYSADKELWTVLRATEDARIRKEINAFSVFFDKYRENIAATVNNAVNNAYIQSHNQPAGIKSYGLVVDLVVNYLLYSE